MKMKTMTAAALILAVGAVGASAQARSSTRIPIHKDMTGTASGVVGTPLTDTITTMVDTTTTFFYPDTLYTYYRPLPTTCNSVDVNAARGVAIKTNLYDQNTMISPDSAKIIALCAVPGQIGSGEMNVANGRTNYAIDIIPNHKKTHTKVIIDAMTGDVISSKQFGGFRGAAGWVRESLEHKENVRKAQKDTMP
jgi:hypothetical protein